MYYSLKMTSNQSFLILNILNHYSYKLVGKINFINFTIFQLVHMNQSSLGGLLTDC